MPIVSNAKILLKRGITDPSTTLDLGEPGFDISANIFYIGKGIGNSPIEFPLNTTNYASITYVDNKFVTNASLNIISGGFY
jgi:hypothetical protein